jgi:hypothetical protein
MSSTLGNLHIKYRQFHFDDRHLDNSGGQLHNITKKLHNNFEQLRRGGR